MDRLQHPLVADSIPYEIDLEYPFPSLHFFREGWSSK
jgi:hypothetical protein